MTSCQSDINDCLLREGNIEEARPSLLRAGQTEQLQPEQPGQPHRQEGQAGDLGRGEDPQVSQRLPRGYFGGSNPLTRPVKQS